MSRMLRWAWDRVNLPRRGRRVRRMRCPLGVERLEDRCLLSAATSFTSVGIGGGGMLGSIAINPMNGQNMSMSTDMGELFETTNANTTSGTSWTISNPYSGGVYGKNYQQVQYTNNANVQYVYDPVGIASNGDGFQYGVAMVTTNDGATWTQMPTPNGADLTQLIADPHNDNQVFAIGTGGSIWFTQNGTAGASATWTLIASTASGVGGDPWSDGGAAQYIGGIYSSATDHYIFLASNYGLLEGISNGSGGYTWSEYGGSQAGSFAGLPSGDGLFSLTGAENVSDKDVYLYAVAEPAGVLAVDNNGVLDNENGQSPTLTNNNIYELKVCVDGSPSNNNSWTQLAALPNDPQYSNAIGVPLRITAQQEYSSSTDNATLYVGGTFDTKADGGQLPPAVFMSTNSGGSWTSLFNPAGTNLYNGPIGPYDGGNTNNPSIPDDWPWGQGANVTGISYYQNDWNSTNTGEIVISTSDGAYMTTNDGSTWTTIAQANSQPEGQDTKHFAYDSTVNPIVTYFTDFGLNSNGSTNDNDLLMGTQDNGLLYSTDGGVQWATATEASGVGGAENYADYNDAQTGQWYVAFASQLAFGAQGDIDDNGGGVIYNNNLGSGTWEWLMNTKTVLPTPSWAASDPSEYGGSAVKSVAVGNGGTAMYVAVDDNASSSSGVPLGGIWATNLLQPNDPTQSLNAAGDWVRLPSPIVGWGPAQGETANPYPTQVVSIDADDIVVTYGADTDSGMANRAGVFLGHITWAGNTPTVKWTDITPEDGWESGAVTGAAGTPIVITTSSTSGLANGDYVVVSGVGGNTNANGTYAITVLSSTAFELNGSTSNGTYTAGTGTWELLPDAARTDATMFTVDPNNPNSWFVGSMSTGALYNGKQNAGLWESTSGLSTTSSSWTESLQSPFGVYDVAIGASGMYASVWNGGLYYSPSDTNISWTLDTNYPYYDPMQIQFNNSNNTLWVTSGGAGTMVANITVPNGVYRLANVNSGLMMADPNSNPNPNVQMIQWGNDNGAEQEWQFTAISGGYYTITNVSSGLYLEGNGSEVLQAKSDGGYDEEWSLRPEADGAWELVNRASGLVADVAGGSLSNGALIDQESDKQATYQFWTLLPVSPPSGPADVMGPNVSASTVSATPAAASTPAAPSGSTGTSGTPSVSGQPASVQSPSLVLNTPASGGNTNTTALGALSDQLFSSPQFLAQLRTSLLVGKRPSNQLIDG